MKTLASFSDVHVGETIVVCGCGQSLNEFLHPEQFITIGVNDIGRRFHPDYLVVVNPRDQFVGDRFRYVESSAAGYIFTQLNLGLTRENVIKFSLGAQGGTDLSNRNVLHFTQNSPYVALGLAVHMGARRIGLIGVDFTENHFFGPTGRHSLAPQLQIIDEQYKQLYQACLARGVEVFNLSRTSRLTAFPKKSIEEFSEGVTPPVRRVGHNFNDHPPDQSAKKIFFINYRFLSCGEVFTDGLRNAAKGLGLSFREAYWDDSELPAKVHEFDPHWLFVVHGRRFVERWRQNFSNIKKAVWLLDEPYEVDDTARWSNVFDLVYVNDPSTLNYHRNAHYLPVGYDAEVHRENGDQKKYQVGFIGGHNETRERYLLALHEAGHLSYVVGGPWRSPGLRRICLAPNIPAAATAELYRQTRIVINLFRDVHHFNHRGIPAYSMNPRVYEGLACGAVVVSETRPEIRAVFPDLPVFSAASELRNMVEDLVKNEERYCAVKRACQEKLAAHNYRERLRQICQTLDFPNGNTSIQKASVQRVSLEEVAMNNGDSHVQSSAGPPPGWTRCGTCVDTSRQNYLIFNKSTDEGLGTEQGLASLQLFDEVDLSFEVRIDDEACFIAKVHQTSQHDQTTNSYHLYCHPRHTYLARHNHVFRSVDVKRNVWQRIRVKRHSANLELEINGEHIATLNDGMLKRGYCFVGVKSGSASVRNLTLKPVSISGGNNGARNALSAKSAALPAYDLLYTVREQERPRVTIVTTVYDRLADLAECLRSVRQLSFRDFEHIIVSDHPPDDVVRKIQALIETESTGTVTFANLKERFNNWGIAPACVGLHLARGEYLCFLSDDNGYTADHLNPLVAALDQDNSLGFVYSSCQYAGRFVLRGAVPRPGGIDLGQPLFRRDIFARHLGNTLPFDMMAWDWHMIDAFIKCGLRWRHIDRPSFLFRLEACRKQARS